MLWYVYERLSRILKYLKYSRHVGALVTFVLAILWSIRDGDGNGKPNIIDYFHRIDKNKDGVVSGRESAYAAILPAAGFLIVSAVVTHASANAFFVRTAVRRYKRNERIHKTVVFPDNLVDNSSLLEYVETEYSESRPLSSMRSGSRKSSISTSREATADHRAFEGQPTIALDLSRQLSDKTQSLLSAKSWMDESFIDEELLLNWDFDVFDLAAKTDEAFLVIGKRCLAGNFDIYPDVDKLCSFLEDISNSYQDVKYHNSLHGATVARSAFSMCKGLGSNDKPGGLNDKLSSSMQFALVLSALIHDVGHPGLTAQFLERAQDELSLRYSDDSPLERMHLAVAFNLMRQPKNRFLRDEEFADMKEPIVRAVLGTDMAKHGQHMRRLDALVDNLKHGGYEGTWAWYWPKKPPPSCRTDEDKLEWEKREQAEFVMSLFLHAADIASPTMRFDQFKRWNGLVQEEFWAQGDREKAEFGELISAQDGYDRDVSPFRLHKFTSGFLTFLVAPYFKALDELSNIKAEGNIASGVDLSVCLKNLEKNAQMHEKSAPPADPPAE